MALKFKILKQLFTDGRQDARHMSPNPGYNLKRSNRVVNTALIIAGLMIAGAIVLLAVYLKHFFRV